MLRHSCVVEKCWHVIFSFIKGLFNHVGYWADESIDLAVGTLADFQENDGALANDLVDNKCGHDDEEDGAECENEVEFAPKDILVCMFDEEVCNLAHVLR